MIIDISRCDKAEVLRVLYNASKPQGMGFMQYMPKPMTLEEAKNLLARTVSFDYVYGRVMKINLSKDQMDVWLYDRDNGEGAAMRALLEARLDVNSVIEDGQNKTRT